MTPKSRLKSAKASAKKPNPKQTIKSKLDSNTRENDSKNTKQCGHGGASMRSEDKGTTLQDTANVSAEPVDSIQPDEPRESAAVPSAAVSGWNGRRRRSRWGSLSVDELVAATTLVQMKNDSN